MKTFNISLKSINDVKDFVNVVNRYDFDVDLTSGRYVVDAKSIMGIFSLDLSKPIKVEVHDDSCDSFCNDIKNFIIWLQLHNQEHLLSNSELQTLYSNSLFFCMKIPYNSHFLFIQFLHSTSKHSEV